MARNIAEQTNKLNIFWMKNQRMLDGDFKTGSVTWTYSLSENKSSIGYTIVKNSDYGDYIRLNYTQTDWRSGEKADLDYKIELVSTRCNYGGKRYWFACPLIHNGKYCGRRVGVLYLVGKHFGCRHCSNIAYYTQSESKQFRVFSVTIPDIDMAWSEVKQKYYNGKLTKKYKRYLRLEEKFESGFLKSLEGTNFNQPY